jgi:hypothetical protein
MDRQGLLRTEHLVPRKADAGQPLAPEETRAPDRDPHAPIPHPASLAVAPEVRKAMEPVVIGFWDSCPLNDMDKPDGMIRRGMTTDQWRQKKREMSIYGPVAEVSLMLILTAFGVMVERVVVFFFSTNDIQF